MSDTGFPQAWLTKAVAHFIDPGTQNVPELKEEIEALLEEQRRILVIIDDIDRLTSEEIRQLFRVVKAVANFPNVMYLLSFDKDVVAGALHDIQGSAKVTHGGTGELYLEKIVQVPFELPVPDRTTLLTIFAESLEAILQDTSDASFDEGHWNNLLWDGIAHFIDTPRDVARLINTISVTYSAVQGDVNVADFVAIETLRVFYPQVYDIVRRNREAFAGHAGANTLFGKKAKDFKPYHDAWLDNDSQYDRDAVQHLVSNLFPKHQAVWGNTYYGADHAESWRKDLRICSQDIFPAYFRLSLPEGTISRSEIEGIIALTNDTAAFGQNLLKLAGERRDDGTSRVGAVLDRLGDYARLDIPEESIPNIVRAFLTVGDALILPEDEDKAFFNRGNDAQMAYLIERLVKRLDKPQRFPLLRSAIEDGQALSLIVDYVSDLGLEHGRLDRTPLPDSEQTVNESQLIELEKLAAKK